MGNGRDDEEEWEEEDESADTETCPSCGREVYHDSERCPYCGDYIVAGGKTRLAKWMWLGVIAAAAAVLVWILTGS